jgi:hypothetical protein
VNEENVIQTPEEPIVVKVPVRTYLHPDSGSRVTYVSTIHAAQPPFYQALAEIIEGIEQDGGLIYFEEVGHPTSAEMKAAPDLLRWGAEVVQERVNSSYRECLDVGLVLQRDVLPCREGWQVHDVTTLGAARIYGNGEMHRQHAENKQEDVIGSTFTLSLRRAIVLQSLAACVNLITGDTSLDAVFPGAELKLAGVREGIVLAALDKQLAATPDASIALVWGAAHLPSYAKQLAKRGFKQDDERWVTAIDERVWEPSTG